MPKAAQTVFSCLSLLNGVRILAVEGPDNDNSDKITVAFSILGGYLSDPEEAQGLSHLWEHGSFLGSVQYPGNGDLTKFISVNGGDMNAVTGPSHVTYCFEICQSKFTELLDRVVDFLVHPVFDRKAVNNEVHILSNEYLLTGCDVKGVSDELLRETAEANSSYSFFSWGSDKSLDSSAKPSLSKRLADRSASFVCGQNVTVAFRTTDACGVREVVKAFKRLSRGISEDAPMDDSEEVTLMDGNTHFCEVYPVNKFQCIIKAEYPRPMMILVWVINKKQLLIRDDILRYLKGKIESEHAGGLIDTLREKNLAFSVQFDHSQKVGEFFTESILIRLTVVLQKEVDLHKAAPILELLFGFLSRLRNVTQAERRDDWRKYQEQANTNSGISAEDLEWSTIRMWYQLPHAWRSSCTRANPFRPKRLEDLLGHMSDEAVQLQILQPTTGTGYKVQRYSNIKFALLDMKSGYVDSVKGSLEKGSTIDPIGSLKGNASVSGLPDVPNATNSTKSGTSRVKGSTSVLVLSDSDSEESHLTLAPKAMKSTSSSTAALEIFVCILRDFLLQLFLLPASMFSVSLSPSGSGIEFSINAPLKIAQCIMVKAMEECAYVLSNGITDRQLQVAVNEIRQKYCEIKTDSRQLSELAMSTVTFGRNSLSNIEASLSLISASDVSLVVRNMIQEPDMMLMIKANTTFNHVQAIQSKLKSVISSHLQASTHQRSNTSHTGTAGLRSFDIKEVWLTARLSTQRIISSVNMGKSSVKRYVSALVVKEYLMLLLFLTIRSKYHLTYGMKVFARRVDDVIQMILEISYMSRMTSGENAETLIRKEVLGELSSFVTSSPPTFLTVAKYKVKENLDSHELSDIQYETMNGNWDQFTVSSQKAQLTRISVTDVGSLAEEFSNSKSTFTITISNSDIKRKNEDGDQSCTGSHKVMRRG